jgi:hypothetical protein
MAVCLLKTLRHIGFTAHSLVPPWDLAISIIDSACESDSDLVRICFDENIPTVMMKHFLTTTSDDSACACLQLVANFVHLAPNRSPLYPEFVADVSRSVTWFLDDVIPLASLTLQACSEPAPWFEYAEQVVGMCAHPAFEMPAQAKAFYASCLSLGFLHNPPNDLSDIGILVPIFCDILPLTDCDQEAVLELIFRYVTHPDAPDDAKCFGCALDALQKPDLHIAEMADGGSAHAMALLECLSTLQRRRSDEQEEASPECQ